MDLQKEPAERSIPSKTDQSKLAESSTYPLRLAPAIAIPMLAFLLLVFGNHLIPLNSLLSGTKPVSTATPVRLPSPEAEKLVRGWYEAQKPGLNPQVMISLKELTTDEIWNRLGIQVFQVSGDTFEYDTFMIRQGRVQLLGTGFGGVGVSDMAVVDLDGDGQPELLYVYSFGSGIHRSILAIYSPSFPAESIFEANIIAFMADLTLRKIDDQQVRVFISFGGESPQPVGQVILQRGVQPALGLQFDGHLSAETLAHLSPAGQLSLSGLAPTLTPESGPTPGTATMALLAGAGDVSQVYVLPADAGSWLPVPAGRRSAAWPSLSPDGRRVAFSVNTSGSGYDILVADLVTGQIHNLTNDAFISQRPLWSPDGKQIAFESDRGEGASPGKVDIYLMAVDGSNIRRMTVNPEGKALAGWSAAGTEIYFTYPETADINHNQAEILAAYNLGNGQIREISRLPERLRGGVQAVVSPDGQSIAYVRNTGSGSAIMLRGGGAERQVSDGRGDAMRPVWSPDGKWLAYTRLEQGQYTPVIVPLAGGQPIVPPVVDGMITSWVGKIGATVELPSLALVEAATQPALATSQP